MKYFKFLMLFVFVGIFQACPVDDDEILAGTLVIMNDSNESVYCYEDFSVNEITISDINYERLKNQVLAANNSTSIKIYQYHFEKNEVLRIFFYKQSTLDNYSWEEIQEQNIFDARYSFTLEELQAMKWELVHDGE